MRYFIFTKQNLRFTGEDLVIFQELELVTGQQDWRVKFVAGHIAISYLESSSLTAHAGLTWRAVSRPLVKGNEDAGYEGGHIAILAGHCPLTGSSVLNPVNASEN